MSQDCLPFFMKQPHVTLTTGTMVQPLSGLDTLTGVDLDDFDKLSGGFRAQSVVEDLRAKLPGYFIHTMEEFTSYLTINSVGLLRNFIGVVIGIAVVVGFIVVSMARYTVVLERTREIGILKALGASSGYILDLLFRETLVIALIGTVLGIAMTYGTQWLMMHAVPASLTQETVYKWWPIAGAISITGALLGAIFPGWNLSLLGFGTPGRELAANYAVKDLGGERVESQDSVHLHLAPKSADVLKQLTRVDLWISVKNNSPVQQKFQLLGGDYRLVTFYLLFPRVLPITNLRARSWMISVLR